MAHSNNRRHPANALAQFQGVRVLPKSANVARPGHASLCSQRSSSSRRYRTTRPRLENGTYRALVQLRRVPIATPRYSAACSGRSHGESSSIDFAASAINLPRRMCDTDGSGSTMTRRESHHLWNTGRRATRPMILKKWLPQMSTPIEPLAKAANRDSHSVIDAGFRSHETTISPAQFAPVDRLQLVGHRVRIVNSATRLRPPAFRTSSDVLFRSALAILVRTVTETRGLAKPRSPRAVNQMPVMAAPLPHPVRAWVRPRRIRTDHG